MGDRSAIVCKNVLHIETAHGSDSERLLECVFDLRRCSSLQTRIDVPIESEGALRRQRIEPFLPSHEHDNSARHERFAHVRLGQLGAVQQWAQIFAVWTTPAYGNLANAVQRTSHQSVRSDRSLIFDALLMVHLAACATRLQFVRVRLAEMTDLTTSWRCLNYSWSLVECRRW